MSLRTLVISDLHLGRPDPIDVVAALEPVLSQTDEVILNGDVAELHIPRHREVASRDLERLRTMLDRRGVRLTIIAGNHDPLVDERRSMRLATGAVLAFHGDAVHPSLAPWSPAARALRAAYRRRLESHPPQERGRLEVILEASREAATHEWSGPNAARHAGQAWRLLLRPFSVLRVLAFWREYPALVADFAGRHAPEAQMVLVGHSHWPGAWEVGGRMILNTGAFQAPHRPHAVSIEGRCVELRPLRRRTDRVYRLDPAPESWRWTLESPQPPAAVSAASTREGSLRPSADEIADAAAATPSRRTPVETPLRSQR